MIYIICVLIFFVKGSVSMTKINYDETTDVKFPIWYKVLSISTKEQTRFENVDKLFEMIWWFHILIYQKEMKISSHQLSIYYLYYQNHYDLS